MQLQIQRYENKNDIPDIFVSDRGPSLKFRLNFNHNFGTLKCKFGKPKIQILEVQILNICTLLKRIEMFAGSVIMFVGRSSFTSR